jgi:hypothetical protein
MEASEQPEFEYQQIGVGRTSESVQDTDCTILPQSANRHPVHWFSARILLDGTVHSIEASGSDSPLLFSRTTTSHAYYLRPRHLE